jgi:hypothetical protein
VTSNSSGGLWHRLLSRPRHKLLRRAQRTTFTTKTAIQQEWLRCTKCLTSASLHQRVIPDISKTQETVRCIWHMHKYLSVHASSLSLLHSMLHQDTRRRLLYSARALGDSGRLWRTFANNRFQPGSTHAIQTLYSYSLLIVSAPSLRRRAPSI